MKTTPCGLADALGHLGGELVGVAEVEGGQAGPWLERAQALEDVPGDGVVLAERVAPGDDEDGVRAVEGGHGRYPRPTVSRTVPSAATSSTRSGISP